MSTGDLRRRLDRLTRDDDWVLLRPCPWCGKRTYNGALRLDDSECGHHPDPPPPSPGDITIPPARHRLDPY